MRLSVSLCATHVEACVRAIIAASIITHSKLAVSESHKSPLFLQWRSSSEVLSAAENRRKRGKRMWPLMDSYSSIALNPLLFLLLRLLLTFSSNHVLLWDWR